MSALLNIEDVELHDGLRVGVVYALKTLAERLGITKALGSSRQGKLALWQIIARLIGQGSRLGAVRMAASYGACDVLEVECFTEDDLYANLAWLMDNQERLEAQLFKHNSAGAGPELLLYDVTSSYLEGMENVLAAFGYNKDGKESPGTG